MGVNVKIKLNVCLLLSVICICLGACGEKEEDILLSSENTPISLTQERTPLSLMHEYNPSDINVIDDKYRTFYEVFVYSFYDSNGDGVGDFQGLTEKLDYINDGDDTTNTDLGCNGIWLMPIMPSTTYHKYDVIDYYDIDSEYGSMEDFEGFMEECEKRDIHILIDLVLNHTSSKHEWFTTACDYLSKIGSDEPDLAECPYVDYYYFSREKKSDVYYPVPNSEWYYEGSFWSEMPDVNLLNNEVRQAFEEVTQFWMDKGVSGFRIDAAKEFVSGNTNANVEILSWLNDSVKAYKSDAYIVAEVWTDISTFEKYYESGIDSVFNFAFGEQGGIIASSLNNLSGIGAVQYGKAMASLENRFSKINPDYIDAPFYTNHDIARSAGYYSGEGSTEKTKLAQAMNLMMTGNVFLYYGEELGMKGSGRDENKRAGMFWSEDENAVGMCNGPKEMETIKKKFASLEEQIIDDSSVYQFVKETIHLRNAYPAIGRGTVTCLEEQSDQNICMIKKEYEGQEIILIWNLGNTAMEVEVGDIALNEQEISEKSIGGALLTGAEKIECISNNDSVKIKLPEYSMVLLK